MTAQFSRSAPLADAFLGAAQLVAAVIAGRNLDVSLANAGYTGVTRAAVMDLAWTTLRAFSRGDFILSRLMAKPLKDETARGLLLTALARLEARPEDAHTTVDQAVTAAARIAGGRYKGVVNGVLRSFLRQREELLTGLDGVARWQHPAWWIARLRKDHPQEWEAILAAGNQHPPMSLRVNHRRVTSADFLAQLAVAEIAARPLDSGALRLDKPLPVERIPGFREGLCSVQDAGAQAAAGLLDLRERQRVLDACAAPGGKAAHILETAALDLLALDAEASRTARIRENLDRLGLAATIQVADARHVDAWWDGRPFERILADVPCSASGVVRRHPDAKWLRRETDIAGFAASQREIVDALWRTLAPGGKMLYATCSVFREENENQIDAFAARHPDARLLTTLTLLPDADHDGFYYALLQKT